MQVKSSELKLTDIYTILDNACTFKHILIVNTQSTGLFLDSMCLNKRPYPLRIKYNSNNFEDFIAKVNHVIRMNKKFDLILVDPYHEYSQSSSIFKILTPLLNETTGILISHDCYPPEFGMTSPVYQKNEWCGVTYAAFIENAYNNPNLYYVVINTDYGLGIVSTRPFAGLTKISAREKQEAFLRMFKNGEYENAYNYFTAQSTDIINLRVL